MGDAISILIINKAIFMPYFITTIAAEHLMPGFKRIHKNKTQLFTLLAMGGGGPN